MQPNLNENGKPATVPVWEAALVGSSPEILDLTKTLWRLAQAQTDTLIVGGAGTGKGLAASLIHRLGPRQSRAFCTVSCSSLTPAEFENELFGREADVFSATRRPGRLEAAMGGVVFLDEVGDLALDQQAKLLAFLETKTFLLPGGQESVYADVQMVLSTSRNLEAGVAGGKFQPELAARFQGSTVHLPLLREHAQDIPALVWFFIQKFNAFYGRKIQRLAPEVLPALQSEPWEGNVAELKNRVEAAVRGCPEQMLQMKDFSAHAGPQAGLSLSGAALDQPYRVAKENLLQDFHRRYLGYHLNQHNWNRSRTARAIGIMREQLNALVRRYKLARPKDQEPGPV